MHVDEGILSVAFVNFNGQIISSKSKYHIEIGLDSDNLTGLWMRAAFAMAEKCSNAFGRVDTFVISYEKVKLAIWPQDDIRMLILLVLLPSTSIEYVRDKLSSFLACHKWYFDCKYEMIPDGMSV